MAVYVDNLVNRGTKGDSFWCLMWADELWELHHMAEAIGLQRSWLQVNEGSAIPYHYQLSQSKRDLALQAGAVFTMPSSWIAATRGRANEGESG